MWPISSPGGSRAKGLRGPFKYWDKGTMATIGRAKAVAESMGFRFSGFPAWLAWLFIHIMYLARFENRVLVLFQWFWNYVTRNRAARLITGEDADVPDTREKGSGSSSCPTTKNATDVPAAHPK